MRKVLPVFITTWVLLFAYVLGAQVPVPFTFTSGTIIDPDQMNTNFSALGNGALNRGGGTMSGTLLVAPGTAALPGIAASGQTGTGVRLASGLFGVSVAGSQLLSVTPTTFQATGLLSDSSTGQVNVNGGQLIVGAAGASFYGTGLVNSTGKIPDLSPTYFTAISASNFTAGTVPVARLGSGTASNTTFLRGDSTWSTIPLTYTFTPVTTTYTALVSDVVITGNGTFTITLYSCAGNAGRWLELKNIGAGTVTVDGAGSETIDGALTFALAVQYQAITIACDGATWHIL